MIDLESKYSELLENAFDTSFPNEWNELVENLCDFIWTEHKNDLDRYFYFMEQHEKYPDKYEEPIKPIRPSVAQIKEKFGGLRFYADNLTEKMQGAVDFAEQLSYHIQPQGKQE